MKNMKKKDTSTAAELASFLWGQISASFDAAHLVCKLHEENGRDIEKAGAALEMEWSKIGGETAPEKPIRALLEACSNMYWAEEDARAFIRGAGFVRPDKVKAEKWDGMIAKQRLHVLCKSVYGGLTNAEAGAHGKGKGKGGAVNRVLTVDQIVKAIDALTSLPAADADKIAKALQAKLA